MRKIAVLVVALFMLAVMGGPALAHHEHTLHLPNGKTVLMKCEPLAAADVHPIHNGLHVALRDRAANGKVSMTADDDPGCPT